LLPPVEGSRCADALDSCGLHLFLDFVVSNFCFRTAGEEFGSQWLRPSPLRKVSLSRVKVCIELVGICKGLRGAEFDAIRINWWDASQEQGVASRAY
jgi:hypothetical protein